MCFQSTDCQHCILLQFLVFINLEKAHLAFSAFRFVMDLTRVSPFTGSILRGLNISGGVKTARGSIINPLKGKQQPIRGRRDCCHFKDSWDLYCTVPLCMWLLHTESLIYRLKALHSAKTGNNYSLGDYAIALLQYFFNIIKWGETHSSPRNKAQLQIPPSEDVSPNPHFPHVEEKLQQVPTKTLWSWSQKGKKHHSKLEPLKTVTKPEKQALRLLEPILAFLNLLRLNSIPLNKCWRDLNKVTVLLLFQASQ